MIRMRLNQFYSILLQWGACPFIKTSNKSRLAIIRGRSRLILVKDHSQRRAKSTRVWSWLTLIRWRSWDLWEEGRMRHLIWMHFQRPSSTNHARSISRIVRNEYKCLSRIKATFKAPNFRNKVPTTTNYVNLLATTSPRLSTLLSASTLISSLSLQCTNSLNLILSLPPLRISFSTIRQDCKRFRLW